MSRVVLVNDRYHGTYSGANWTAWISDCPDEINDDDVTCSTFWYYRETIPKHGRGATPEEALADLGRYYDLNDYTHRLRDEQVS